VIVDAPPDVDAIVRLLTQRDLIPVALLVTHGHVDHAAGAGGVVYRTGVSAYLHPDDDFLASDPVGQVRSLFGFVPPGAEELAPPDRFSSLSHGQRLDLAGFDFEVRHTPGHTPGHCIFVVESEGIVFSGDQLFEGSVGRTDFSYGSWEDLMDSMRTQVMTLPDDMRVLPGHGPETTIGRERTANPFILEWLNTP
jgi:glyoxylase-like metal-dependent hydrolase (beta-lactamase superfamily II)